MWFATHGQYLCNFGDSFDVNLIKQLKKQQIGLCSLFKNSSSNCIMHHHEVVTGLFLNIIVSPSLDMTHMGYNLSIHFFYIHSQLSPNYKFPCYFTRTLDLNPPIKIQNFSYDCLHSFSGKGVKSSLHRWYVIQKHLYPIHALKVGPLCQRQNQQFYLNT